MPDLIDKAARGNHLAREILGKVVHAIADTVQITVQTYNLNLVIIGGGTYWSAAAGLAYCGTIRTDGSPHAMFVNTVRSNFQFAGQPHWVDSVPVRIDDAILG